MKSVGESRAGFAWHQRNREGLLDREKYQTDPQLLSLPHDPIRSICIICIPGRVQSHFGNRSTHSLRDLEIPTTLETHFYTPSLSIKLSSPPTSGVNLISMH